MSEMIERIADAIEEWSKPYDSPFDRKDFLEGAVEVLLALREPTADMLDEGDRAMTGDLLTPGDSRGPWVNMIDQALIGLSPLRSAGSADLYGVERAEE